MTRKSVLTTTIIFLLIGIGLIIGAIIYYFYTRSIVANGTLLDATIINIIYDTSSSSSDRVIVEYFVNGIKYQRDLGSFDSSMYVGEVIKIYLIDGDPNKIFYVDSMNIGVIIMLAIGAIFTFVSAIELGVNIRILRLSKLKETGHATKCEVIDVKLNLAISVSHMHPMVVICKDKNGKTYKSFNIYSPVTLQVGDYVNVYSDENNEKRYYIDYQNKVAKDILIDTEF